MYGVGGRIGGEGGKGDVNGDGDRTGAGRERK